MNRQEAQSRYQLSVYVNWLFIALWILVLLLFVPFSASFQMGFQNRLVIHPILLFVLWLLTRCRLTSAPCPHCLQTLRVSDLGALANGEPCPECHEPLSEQKDADEDEVQEEDDDESENELGFNRYEVFLDPIEIKPSDRTIGEDQSINSTSSSETPSNNPYAPPTSGLGPSRRRELPSFIPFFNAALEFARACDPVANRVAPTPIGVDDAVWLRSRDRTARANWVYRLVDVLCSTLVPAVVWGVANFWSPSNLTPIQRAVFAMVSLVVVVFLVSPLLRAVGLTVGTAILENWFRFDSFRVISLFDSSGYLRKLKIRLPSIAGLGTSTKWLENQIELQYRARTAGLVEVQFVDTSQWRGLVYRVRLPRATSWQPFAFVPKLRESDSRASMVCHEVWLSIPEEMDMTLIEMTDARHPRPGVL